MALFFFRWDRVCNKSSERKSILHETWSDWDELTGLLHHFEVWSSETDLNLRVQISYTRADLITYAKMFHHCKQLRVNIYYTASILKFTRFYFNKYPTVKISTQRIIACRRIRDKI